MDTIRTKIHRQLVDFLIAQRQELGLSQMDLAARVKRSQTWVSRVELGGRRIDIVEFLLLARALEFDPVKAIKMLSRISA